MMEDDITIIQRYPNLGQCDFHFEDIKEICTQPLCQNMKYCCQKCITSIHQGHKRNKNFTFAKELFNKLKQAQLKQKNIGKNAMKELITSTKTLISLANDFKNGINNITSVLKQINTYQCEFYCQVLKSKPEELFTYCKSELSQSPQYIKNLIQKCIQSKIDDNILVQNLPQYIKSLQIKIATFEDNLSDIIDQAVDINSRFDINCMMFDIKSMKRQEQKIMQESNSSVSDSNGSGRKGSTESLISVNLQGKDYYGSKILQQLKKYPVSKIQNLNLEKNAIDTAGLKQILSDERIRLQNLKKLNLKNNTLDEGCLKIIFDSYLPKLQQINLGENFLSDTDKFLLDFQIKRPDIQIKLQ